MKAETKDLIQDLIKEALLDQQTDESQLTSTGVAHLAASVANQIEEIVDGERISTIQRAAGI